MLCFILAACLATAIPSGLGRGGESAEDTRPIIMASDDPDIQRTSPERDSLHREESTKVIHTLQNHFVTSNTNYPLAFFHWYSTTFMACIVPFYVTTLPAA